MNVHPWRKPLAVMLGLALIWAAIAISKRSNSVSPIDPPAVSTESIAKPSETKPASQPSALPEEQLDLPAIPPAASMDVEWTIEAGASDGRGGRLITARAHMFVEAGQPLPAGVRCVLQYIEDPDRPVGRQPSILGDFPIRDAREIHCSLSMDQLVGIPPDGSVELRMYRAVETAGVLAFSQDQQALIASSRLVIPVEQLRGLMTLATADVASERDAVRGFPCSQTRQYNPAQFLRVAAQLSLMGRRDACLALQGLAKSEPSGCLAQAQGPQADALQSNHCDDLPLLVALLGRELQLDSQPTYLCDLRRSRTWQELRTLDIAELPQNSVVLLHGWPFVIDFIAVFQEAGGPLLPAALAHVEWLAAQAGELAPLANPSCHPLEAAEWGSTQPWCQRFDAMARLPNGPGRMTQSLREQALRAAQVCCVGEFQKRLDLSGQAARSDEHWLWQLQAAREESAWELRIEKWR